MKRFTIVFIGLLTAILLASCASQTTVPQATVTFCNSLGTYDQTVASLEALGADATIGQVKDAQRAADQAFDQVVLAGAAVTELKLNELQAAQRDLQQTVNGISDALTVQEAKATIAPKLLAVTNAARVARTSVQCP